MATDALPLEQVVEPRNGADRYHTHSDDELVRRWIRHYVDRRPPKHGGEYLWAKVMRVFAVGSTSAKDICKRHGFNPDEMVHRAN